MANNNSGELPDPELVLRAATEEVPQRVLDDYTDAIHALREKHFTFREIAEWLKKFGFEVDHNAVWRAYGKTVPDDQAYQEANEDEQLEDEEACQKAELNGRVTTITSAPENSVKPPSKSEKATKRTSRKRKKH